ncbi:hypothetical protein A2U01_0033589, partial [Trifolium medium]|nr:hypothetical protein [Trifolium medium]
NQIRTDLTLPQPRNQYRSGTLSTPIWTEGGAEGQRRRRTTT